MLAVRKAALIGIALLLAAVILVGCKQSTGGSLKFAAQWTGAGSAAGKIDAPEGLAIDPHGQLLIADTWNDRVLRCDPRDFAVKATLGQRGVGNDQFECVRGVTTDARGHIYAVDTWNQRIKKFSPDGKLLLCFGEKGAPLGNNEADGKWAYPAGVAVDSKGNVYVSDYGNNRIEKFSAKGAFLLKWGVLGRQDGQLNKPGALAMDSQDRLYVADTGNNRIQRFRCDVSGARAFDGQWGKDGRLPGEFDRPYGLCVDKQGNSYVTDFGNHRLQKFDASGRLVYVYGSFGSKEGELDSPVAVAVDDQGAVFVSDWGNNRIQKFVP